ncbi:hypothetical protein PCE1_004044 [Barthelona sp. PCE]
MFNSIHILLFLILLGFSTVNCVYELTLRDSFDLASYSEFSFFSIADGSCSVTISSNIPYTFAVCPLSTMHLSYPNSLTLFDTTQYDYQCMYAANETGDSVHHITFDTAYDAELLFLASDGLSSVGTAKIMCEQGGASGFLSRNWISVMSNCLLLAGLNLFILIAFYFTRRSGEAGVVKGIVIPIVFTRSVLYLFQYAVLTMANSGSNVGEGYFYMVEALFVSFCIYHLMGCFLAQEIPIQIFKKLKITRGHKLEAEEEATKIRGIMIMLFVCSFLAGWAGKVWNVIFPPMVQTGMQCALFIGYFAMDFKVAGDDFHGEFLQCDEIIEAGLDASDQFVQAEGVDVQSIWEGRYESVASYSMITLGIYTAWLGFYSFLGRFFWNPVTEPNVTLWSYGIFDILFIVCLMAQFFNERWFFKSETKFSSSNTNIRPVQVQPPQKDMMATMKNLPIEETDEEEVMFTPAEYYSGFESVTADSEYESGPSTTANIANMYTGTDAITKYYGPEQTATYPGANPSTIAIGGLQRVENGHFFISLTDVSELIRIKSENSVMIKMKFTDWDDSTIEQFGTELDCHQGCYDSSLIMITEPTNGVVSIKLRKPLDLEFEVSYIEIEIMN